MNLFVLKGPRIPREHFYIDYPRIHRDCITFISTYEELYKIQTYEEDNVYMEYEIYGLDYKTRDAFKHTVVLRGIKEFKPFEWTNSRHQICPIINYSVPESTFSGD